MLTKLALILQVNRACNLRCDYCYNGSIVSCDGSAAIHDRYRRRSNGSPSAEIVLATLERLVAAEKDVEVILTLRPDTLHALTSNVAFLWGLGLRRLALSLDLWTQWRAEDLARLAEELRSCADLWRGWLPQAEISSKVLSQVLAMPA